VYLRYTVKQDAESEWIITYHACCEEYCHVLFFSTNCDIQTLLLSLSTLKYVVSIINTILKAIRTRDIDVRFRKTQFQAQS